MNPFRKSRPQVPPTPAPNTTPPTICAKCRHRTPNKTGALILCKVHPLEKHQDFVTGEWKTETAYGVKQGNTTFIRWILEEYAYCSDFNFDGNCPDYEELPASD